MHFFQKIKKKSLFNCLNIMIHWCIWVRRSECDFGPVWRKIFCLINYWRPFSMSKKNKIEWKKLKISTLFSSLSNFFMSTLRNWLSHRQKGQSLPFPYIYYPHTLRKRAARRADAHTSAEELESPADMGTEPFTIICNPEVCDFQHFR